METEKPKAWMSRKDLILINEINTACDRFFIKRKLPTESTIAGVVTDGHPMVEFDGWSTTFKS